MKVFILLLIASFHLNAMHYGVCDENSLCVVDITGLTRERVLQAFYTFVESKAGVAVPVELNELDFGPIRQKNWKIEYLKGYYLPIDLSETKKVDASELCEAYGNMYLAQDIVTSLKEGTCLKY